MNDYDYHSLFYYGILCRLQNFRGTDHEQLKPPKEIPGAPSFHIGWLRRAESYPHQYLREKFIQDRDILVTGYKEEDGQHVVVMRVKRNEEKAILYKKAVRHLFGANYVVAKRELVQLMEKFYELTIENESGQEIADYSQGRYESHNYVDVPFRNTHRGRQASVSGVDFDPADEDVAIPW